MFFTSANVHNFAIPMWQFLLYFLSLQAIIIKFNGLPGNEIAASEKNKKNRTFPEWKHLQKKADKAGMPLGMTPIATSHRVDTY